MEIVAGTFNLKKQNCTSSVVPLIVDVSILVNPNYFHLLFFSNFMSIFIITIPVAA